jgi:hypothetical protein
MRHELAALLGAALVSITACAATASAPPPEPAPAPAAAPPAAAGQRTAQVNPHAKAMAAFQERVKEFLALKGKLRSGLPSLSNEATPDELYKHQIDARRTAKPGDVFNPDMRVVIRTLMAQVFGGPDGRQLKADIMDENPGRIKVAINQRYPDNVPLSTVPPQVLAGLPKLPTDLEYRFLGRALILLDTEAHLIVDLMENAIP